MQTRKDAVIIVIAVVIVAVVGEHIRRARLLRQKEYAYLAAAKKVAGA